MPLKLPSACLEKGCDQMPAKFGPAGNADTFPYRSSIDAPRWLRELGLDCYEYQCGKGVNVGEDTAR